MRTAALESLLLATLALAGCTQTYYTRPGMQKPATAVIPSGDQTAMIAPADRTVAWQHAVVALLDQGYVPTVLNDAAGYISAKRREDLANDALVGTMATVVISTEGAVRVEVSGAGVYTSEEAFLKAIADRQALILQAVMAARSPVSRRVVPTSTSNTGTPQ